MAFVVTLKNWIPPMREDDPTPKPWTRARLRESPDGTADWSVLQEYVFADPDPDPRAPRPRSFTTELATLENGWYEVEFVDADGDTDTVGPVQNQALPKWAPTMQDIAAKLRARTKDNKGNELGIFTASTRPTAEQVEVLIYDAVNDMNLIIGDSTNEKVFNYAKGIATIKTAMDVELSYFPEQIQQGMSPYPALERQLERDLKELYRVIDPDGSGGQAPGAAALLPKFTYPEDAGGMVGWGTRW